MLFEVSLIVTFAGTDAVVAVILIVFRVDPGNGGSRQITIVNHKVSRILFRMSNPQT